MLSEKTARERAGVCSGSACTLDTCAVGVDSEGERAGVCSGSVCTLNTCAVGEDSERETAGVCSETLCTPVTKMQMWFSGFSLYSLPIATHYYMLILSLIIDIYGPIIDY